MMDELAGKRIVILGLARQGKALARFATAAGASVVVSDLRPAENFKSELDELAGTAFEAVLGEHPPSLLDGADVLAISGGVPADIPLVQTARERGIQVTNDSFEFFKRVPATVIGITGSAGKTTTTALTGAMIRQSGRRAWVGGNIGVPLISELGNIHPDDTVIQELSSFQLELWTESPPVSAVLNVTPNHLDRHKSMKAYSAAKANILQHQDPGDVAVVSADDPGAQALRNVIKGRLRQFSVHIKVEDGAFVRHGKVWLSDGVEEAMVCDLDAIPIRGWHNVLNVLAASVLADSVGISKESIAQAATQFNGIEHRLELISIINEVQYVNDSIATAPERAIAAMDSFTEPLLLLAGGQDKEMEWEAWTSRVHERVKTAILFGEMAEQMESRLLTYAGSSPNKLIVRRVATMAQAAALAYELAAPGDVVLLAPGGTSFDAFDDFAERGTAFRELVHSLAQEKKN